MTIKYYFKGNGNDYGFYIIDDRYSKSPDGSYLISEEDYKEYSNNSNEPTGCYPEWDNVHSCMCWGNISLDECKQNKLDEITTQYNELVYSGFSSDGVSYESTLENQSRIMMAKMSGGGMVIDGGKMVMLNASEADQVFVDMNTYINQCNERYAKAQSEIESATTNDQVNAVVL